MSDAVPLTEWQEQQAEIERLREKVAGYVDGMNEMLREMTDLARRLREANLRIEELEEGENYSAEDIARDNATRMEEFP